MLSIAAWLHGQSSRQSGGGERTSAPITNEVSPRGLPWVGADSPFLRWVARKPDLSPADGTRESLDAWMAATGATPDDVETICELRGWLLPPAIPAILEIPEPAMAANPEPPPVIVETRIIPAIQTRKRKKAPEAAEQFIEWVRVTGQCGTYHSREFSELCDRFFEDQNIIPIYENKFRPALELLRDDITKSRSDDKYRDDRKRHYRWTVHESEAESDTTPWTDLPERQAQAA